MTDATPRPMAAPRVALALVAVAIAFTLALTGSAAAKPLIGKDGKIHACYRVKGKPKGELRVVKSPKARCKRGERKVNWVVSGAVGPAGGSGAAGTTGAVGHQGSSGASSSTATLEEKVVALTDRVEDLEGLTERVEELEGILQGVTNKALTDTIAAVSGLTNEQLLAAVAATPLVNTLCGEMTEVISQTNDLRDSVDSLVSILSGTLLGGIFGGIGLPSALPETLTCPTP